MKRQNFFSNTVSVALVLLSFMTCLTFSYQINGTTVAKSFLKSCAGWCLKKYKVAKLFIEQDLDHYDPKLVELDYLGGGFPRLVLVDEEGNNLKTYNLSELSRGNIRKVFKSLEIYTIKPLRPLDDIDSNKVN